MHDKHSWLDTLLKSLDDIQAQEVTVIDVREQTTITDFMIICNGRSSRHVKSISEHVMQQMKTTGLPALSHHGVASGDWALMDFGDFVLHVMQVETRAFYHLEGLWQETT